MGERKSPGHSITEEKSAVAPIEGVPSGIGAFVGFAEWGPIGESIKINTFEEAKAKLGNFLANAFLMYELFIWFKISKGGTVYVVRTAHYTDITDPDTLVAVKASEDLLNGVTPVVTINGKYHGVMGNKISAKATRTNKINTDIAEDLTTVATNIVLENVNGIIQGSVIFITDTTNDVLVRVTSIVSSQKRIYFDRLTVQGADIIKGVNSSAKSRDFQLEVYFENSLVETIDNLSMYPENVVEYVETKVDEESDWIEAIDLSAGLEPEEPTDDQTIELTGGDDGLDAVVDQDLVGSETGKTGLYAFDPVDEQLNISIPEVQSATIAQGIMNYCEARKYRYGIVDIPFDQTPDEAVEFVEDNALVSNYISTFYPHVKIADPLTGQNKLIPISGVALGQLANIHSQVGKGPWTAFAGVEDGRLRFINALESEWTNDETYRDVLYPKNINPVYFKKGYGFLLYGVRNLEVIGGEFPQIPERLTFLFAEQAIDDGTQWVEFQNNDISLEKRFTRSVKQFLRGLWADGGLRGATEEEAFEIVIDESFRGTKDFKAKIGLATHKATEFVYINFHKKVKETV